MNLLSISIPDKLLCFQKVSSEVLNCEENNYKSDMYIEKDQCGKIKHIDYYTSAGDLYKRVMYNGSAIACTQHFRNNMLYIAEEYKDNHIIQKTVYDQSGNITATINYEYTREQFLTKISKVQDGHIYCIEYGYDELNRVNSRTIVVNTQKVEEQKYRYDIMDRVVEYKDSNQQIRVNKISQDNELVSYTITDKIGNEISITNVIIDNIYHESEVLLNGHSIVVKDVSYMDNIMLKKPYTTEDDLELAVSSILNSGIYSMPSKVDLNYTASKKSDEDVLKDSNCNEDYIDYEFCKKVTEDVMPINLRKLKLFNSINKQSSQDAVLI